MIETIKRYFIFLIGLLIFGVGLAFIYLSLLGSDPIGVFETGLSYKTNIDIWIINIMLGLAEVTIGFFIEKKYISIATFVSIFCSSYAINLGYLLIPETNVLSTRIIYFLIGALLYSVGCAIQQYAHCGFNNLDCMLFSLKKLLHIDQYYKVKWLVDIVFFILGFILGGTINVGTIFFLAFAGILIQFFKSSLDKTGFLKKIQ